MATSGTYGGTGGGNGRTNLSELALRNSTLTVFFNGDEEIGSPGARNQHTRNGSEHDAVMSFEGGGSPERDNASRPQWASLFADGLFEQVKAQSGQCRHQHNFRDGESLARKVSQ